ncbi:MAG: hypothetical protein K2O35_03125, partial [Clostridia bacterium]|nr:hypothetical protein [Clostridia bacterium]
LLAKSRCKKAEREMDYAKDEYEKNEARQRDENMRMMFMSMMGGQNSNMGQPQGSYIVQEGLGIDEMRGLISETVAALLPGVQQMLPQQAGINEDAVQKMLDQNDEKIQKMMEKNDERIEKLMEKIIELSSAQKEESQVVEKIVEKVVEVPVEVEKIVEKEVPVEIEKIVEKEVKVSAPAKPKIEKPPRLTLDEAYALLSEEQKKYFDGLREYALTKYKCKEKKSTYFVVYGQTSTNPLVKLTIKKDTTVALLKMEDEYMKDIRRDASGDGTKVRVKETEVIVSDKQAFETAKKMVDLRDDQIERYKELLIEQRAMKNKK